MSWIEQIKNQYIIQTGDGREHIPKWISASRSKEFNVSRFEFVKIKGSKLDRRLPMGTEYDIEVYFDGENHLDLAQALWDSADDPRDWTLRHPLYGVANVAPLKLKFDDKDRNCTKITGIVQESILDSNPKGSINPVDKIAADQESLIDIFNAYFQAAIPLPGPRQKNTLLSNTSKIYEQGKTIATTADEVDAYFDLFNKANDAILNATQFPLQAIQTINEMINYPSKFITSVKQRIDNLVTQYTTISEAMLGLFLNAAFPMSKSDKVIYENNMGVLIGSIAVASTTNYQYSNRSEVTEVINIIADTFDDYKLNLDSIQSDESGSTDDYTANFEGQKDLSDLVNETISNLYIISQNQKQERTKYIDKDSNLIILAHRFYGLQVDDSTIRQFIDVNKIGLNELLQIEKGRTITYYV